MTRNYKLDFGVVSIKIEGNLCTGVYQESGRFSGTIVGEYVKAKWQNQGKEGLLELDLSDNQLKGKWKQGLEEGPMRGKWEGVLIDSLDDNDELVSMYSGSEGLLYNLFISADANNRDKEISNETVSLICDWAQKYGIDRDRIIINKVFNAEQYNSFCEFFIPITEEVSVFIPSMIQTISTLKECNFWIYWHEHGLDIKKIRFNSDQNWDLDSSDKLFIDTSDLDSIEGEGALENLVHQSVMVGDTQTEFITISFDQRFEHLLPYEITLFSKTLSRNEFSAFTQDQLDELLEEFEENRSSFAFADCDDFEHSFTNDLKGHEIKMLLANGVITENIRNEVSYIDKTGDYQIVFFYVYEECTWEDMLCEVETNDHTNLWYRVNWVVLGPLKYIDSIDVLKDEERDILDTIYPCTDGASPGHKYSGKTFVMVIGGQGQILLNLMDVNALNISVFSEINEL
jgi:hypothetical protein